MSTRLLIKTELSKPNYKFLIAITAQNLILHNFAVSGRGQSNQTCRNEKNKAPKLCADRRGEHVARQRHDILEGIKCNLVRTVFNSF